MTAGGSITVLESSGYAGAWTTLDPAENKEGAATQDFMTAIYGQLFELGAGGKIVPDLATGYTYSPNAETVTITLRQGVKFTDGTPFNAQAVAYNWNRDLGPTAIKNGLNPPWLVAEQKAPKGSPPGTAEPALPGDIQVTGPYTIVVHQIAPNGAFIDQLFDSIPNWIASPTALQKDGASFGQNPVGAGPFVVSSNTPNDELVVKKNPTYWQSGYPLLDQITFKTVGSDEAAYEAMLAGEGQVYENMSTTQLINESASHFTVDNNLGTSPYDLQLNTAVPPFNNPKARQAIYAATNFAPILQHLFGGRYPTTESFTGPGGICYEQTVPGYQGYDPTLAKQLIQQSGLNNVTIQLGTIALSTAQESMQALATEWEAIGLKVKQTSLAAVGADRGLRGERRQVLGVDGPDRGRLRPGRRRRRRLQVHLAVAVQRGARPQAGHPAERGPGLHQPEHPVRLLRPGGGVHRQELLRAVLLHLLPGQHLGPRRLRPRPHHAAGLRRGRADDPVGGRFLQRVGLVTAA